MTTTRHYFYDVPDGDTILLDVVDESNGYRLSTFMMPEDTSREHFTGVKNVKCRDDDIFLNSYPKTGTNWLWEMITLMKNKTSTVTGDNKGIGMLEAMPFSVLDGMSSPRILNSHLKVQYLPKESVEKKLKTVLICRNPKDVAVSFYNHTKGLKPYEYSGKFENYLQMFVRGEVDYGSYPEYLMEWQRHIRDNPDVPFHVLYYEDLKEDCYTELKKLRDFLELEATDDLIKEIVDSCSIKKMRESKPKQMSEEAIKNWTLVIKPEYNMLRKGQIGDWKNWFTEAQSEMFDAWWEKETKGLEMFKFRYV